MNMVTTTAPVGRMIDLDTGLVTEPERTSGRPGEGADQLGAAAPALVTTLRCVLYGRHRILLDGLAMLLGSASDVSLVGATSDDHELQELCTLERPDAVIVTIDSELNAEYLIANLRRRHRSVRIVAIPTRRTWLSPARLQQAGATVVLSHGTALAGLVDVVRSDADVPEITPISRVQPLRQTGTLTPRELDVLRLVAAGLTTGEIGPRLGISPKTVENHKQRLFAKLGVQNQAHAVSIAMRAGLLDIPGQRLIADA
jgi:DNA-binding NarL/FixJ family response regulator